MTSCSDLRILFRAAAGPRRGYGHLVRCRSLARALGVRPLVALRGGRRVMDTAVALGCDVVRGTAVRVLSGLRPDVLVVDDPIASDARPWIRAARRVDCLVVSIHALGLGCLDADLVVDGSVTNNACARNGRTLADPKYAVLDPSLSERGVPRQPDEQDRDPYSVLVALGGGPHAELANDIAEAIVESNPQARVRIAGGFVGIPREEAARIAWIGPTGSLNAEMALATVAAVGGGGVSLDEACAHDNAAVGVPVVAAQRPTVTAFVKRTPRGVTRGRVTAQSVAGKCAELLTDDEMRRHTARMGRKLIDGRGAFRVADAVSRLAQASRGTPTTSRFGQRGSDQMRSTRRRGRAR
jgi:spore coat polysaccharide biosynthesis predicted glycosyltransferase SpsG